MPEREVPPAIIDGEEGTGDLSSSPFLSRQGEGARGTRAGGVSSGGTAPPLWADVLLTLWVVVVGVFYFGGFFFPAIGGRTAVGAAFYAGMIFVSVLVLALRFLRGAPPKP